MAKGDGGGKLSKLRCMIKRWNSSGRIKCSISAEGGAGGGGGGSVRLPDAEEGWHSASFHSDGVPPGLQPVYVGKSRRRYLVDAGIADHPLFRVLVDRCGSGGGGGGGGNGATVVGCEVVMFEHLLWMLENADPPPESLDELVEFYAY